MTQLQWPCNWGFGTSCSRDSKKLLLSWATQWRHSLPSCSPCIASSSRHSLKPPKIERGVGKMRESSVGSWDIDIALTTEWNEFLVNTTSVLRTSTLLFAATPLLVYRSVCSVYWNQRSNEARAWRPCITRLELLEDPPAFVTALSFLKLFEPHWTSKTFARTNGQRFDGERCNNHSKIGAKGWTSVGFWMDNCSRRTLCFIVMQH